MLNKNLFELSYWFRLKFNLSDTHISWKGYLIGSLSPKINIHLMAYKKKQTVRRCLPSKILLSLSTSGGFFPMQSIFLFKTTRTSNMGLKLSKNM